MELKILYEDAQLAVCLKPPGMLSEEEGMPKRLCEVLDGDFFCVHRLDKAVGIVAGNEAVHIVSLTLVAVPVGVLAGLEVGFAPR